MENSFSPCLKPASLAVDLIFWGGATERIVLSGREKPLLAGEIMFRFPKHVVCHSDSFFIGRPVPALASGVQLLPSRTYFVLPIDRLPGDSNDPLTVSSLASLSASKSAPQFAGGGQSPFEYVRGADGRTAIKVQPEFVTKLISVGDVDQESRALCSTPELRKHYERLVGAKDRRPWSPKLEKIEEKEKEKEKRRMLHSTSRLIMSPAKSVLHWRTA
ncbi:uncharacterized protein LOC141816578 [Curcuma longa]|uniref:uncharacterized protein LOC141816578 n=1 Tax=Curcuma longa TaxID=136217 RepID=UPI003D9E0EDD